MKTILVVLSLTILVSISSAKYTADSTVNIVKSQNRKESNQVFSINKSSNNNINLNSDSALNYYKRLLKQNNILNNDSCIALAKFSIGTIELHNKNYVQSENYAYQSLLIYHKLNKYQEVGQCYILLGQIHQNQGMYYYAISNYQKAINEFKKINNIEAIAKMYCCIGEMMYFLNHFKQAETYFIKSVNILKNSKQGIEIANSYNFLGKVYLEQKKSKDALYCFNKAQHILTEFNGLKGIECYYDNIGNVYYLNKQYELALQFYNKSLLIKDSLNDYVGKTITLGNIVKVKLSQNKGDESISYINKLYSLAKQNNNVMQIQNAYGYYSKSYELENNYRFALFYNKLYNSLKDSLSSLKFKKNFYYQINNDIDEGEQNKSLLKNKNLFKSIEGEEANEKYKNQVFVLYSVITIIALLVVVTILMYYLKTNRSKNKIIKLEKELIVYMQKAVNQQMNPHFIFNSLNSIQYYLLNNDKLSTSKYISMFSKLMRLTLENSQSSLVSVSSELEAITLYLELEKIRYKNKFDFEINISPKLESESILIPSLIIQPIVENAIWHGIMHLEHEIKGHIIINLNIKDGMYCLAIIDNGIGRKRSNELKTLYRPKHKSYSTQITNYRINVINQIYKKKILIHYTDLFKPTGEPAGTRVEITFPDFPKLTFS